MEREKGFTLLEILLAFAVVMAVLLLGVIAVGRINNLGRVRSTKDEITGLMLLAREMSLSGKDDQEYQVVISGRLATIEGATDGLEVKRFVIDDTVTLTPASLTWRFQGLTGDPVCGGVCSLVISLGEASETIEIGQGGVIR